MSMSRSTAITVRRYVCGARNFMRPIQSAISCAAILFQFSRGVGAIFEAIVSSQAGRLPWGEDHHRVYRKLLNHRIGLAAICEDLPEEHNRVTLDPDLKDSSGIPAPRIDYTISANSLKMMQHG